jgi:hypothetical protein
VGWIMDSPYTLYAICILAVLIYFVFAIATTWLFMKIIVLKSMPDGRKIDAANKISRGETSKTCKGTE